MAGALWVVGGVFVVVYFGTWLLQIAIVLLQLTLRLIGGAVVLAFGLMSMLALVFLDRKQLGRIWRNERLHADHAALPARERWN